MAPVLDPPSTASGSSPAVSVVIPCYQQAEYLAEAVDSVIGQTFGDWEIVIVDDGSTDATAAVASDLIARHPARRIRLIQQPNEGLPCARNSGIAASSGRYILPLDADDRLMPMMLERTVAVLDADPGVAVVYTDYQRFGADDRVVETGPWSVDALTYACQLSGATLYRREVWSAVGGYNPNMRGGYEDWDFWIGAAERGFQGRRIPEPLFGYRIKPSSMVRDAIARHGELTRQMRKNHPALFTPGRRLRHGLHRMRDAGIQTAKRFLRPFYRRLVRRRGRQPG